MRNDPKAETLNRKQDPLLIPFPCFLRLPVVYISLLEMGQPFKTLIHHQFSSVVSIWRLQLWRWTHGHLQFVHNFMLSK